MQSASMLGKAVRVCCCKGADLISCARQSCPLEALTDALPEGHRILDGFEEEGILLHPLPRSNICVKAVQSPHKLGYVPAHSVSCTAEQARLPPATCCMFTAGARVVHVFACQKLGLYR